MSIDLTFEAQSLEVNELMHFKHKATGNVYAVQSLVAMSESGERLELTLFYGEGCQTLRLGVPVDFDAPAEVFE